MTVKIKEWVQDEWITAGVNRFANAGDFADLRGLAPSYNGRRLVRGPDWSNLLQHAGLIDVQGMFYDYDNARYCLIGTNGSSQLACGYFNSSWSFTGPNALVTAIDDLGGRSMLNVRYFGGYLWLIGDDSYVYRGTDYTSTLTAFYSTADASILVPYGGRMYMITDTGHVYRQNDADDAFESYFDPVSDFTPLYGTPFRGYLLIVGLHDDGRLSFYRLSVPSATHLHEMATIYAPRINILGAGCLFTVHDHDLYFSPGPADASSTHTTDIFLFDGSKLTKLCDFEEDVAVGTGTAGLLTWEDKIIYYVMTGSDARFRTLTGRISTFTRYAPAAMEFGSLNINSIAASLNDAILVTAHDATPNQGIHYAIKTNRFDGWFDTAWLDFGHPGKEKRLESITALLNDKATNYEVTIYYRTDDATSWTTVVDAQDGSKIVQATSIGATFTLLQVRVEIDDSTGNDLDIGIEAVSVIYTVDE